MNWEDINLSEASPNDALSISAIYNQYLGEATMDTKSVDPEFYANFIRNKSEKEKMYVLKLGNQIIAFSQIKKYSHKHGYRFTCETSTFFDKAFRNKGLGSKFKKFIIGECASLGYHHIVARIMKINKVSVDYNLKLGYEIVGIQKEAGFVDGQWHDIVVMQYIIR